MLMVFQALKEVVRILQHATADFTIQRLDSIKNLYLEKKII